MESNPTKIKKIVVIGPESTGKSTLCEQLAAHYQTIWVKEYAREYLLKNGTQYTYDQLLDIARGQLDNEALGLEQLEQTNQSNLLIIDTDMQVMKVWCEYVFGNCHRWILDQIVQRKYDLYLLCDTDLPWVKDELREYPDLEARNQLFQHYKTAMLSQNTPWVDIKGLEVERLHAAVSAIDALLKQG